ncbi:hypothetical protein BN59_00502 [Legionella massiliensis]|uniref:Uncharacterized protein n=1 Tax=Legionella massiliensis TaxID=1034943 RepID=A0A078KPB1_9GAMM|nr:hypothetical protein BN59_00502 [Legionella massiliensis]CEE11973.1 hypothetical protein BN1094_00502 [Legionella massiliensis]
MQAKSLQKKHPIPSDRLSFHDPLFFIWLGPIWLQPREEFVNVF